MIKCEVNREHMKMSACGPLEEIVAEWAGITRNLYENTLEVSPELAEKFKRLTIKCMVDENTPMWEGKDK